MQHTIRQNATLRGNLDSETFGLSARDSTLLKEGTHPRRRGARRETQHPAGRALRGIAIYPSPVGGETAFIRYVDCARAGNTGTLPEVTQNELLVFWTVRKQPPQLNFFRKPETVCYQICKRTR